MARRYNRAARLPAYEAARQQGNEPMSQARKQHWEGVYSSKSPGEVSWYQPEPARSLRLIAATGTGDDDPIIDAGGGASTLVDHLLDRGYSDITVLDLSGAALAHARQRLGARAENVTWIEGDVTEFRAPRRYALWHDRAVFHFLTDRSDRQRYVDAVTAALLDRGHLVLSTFGPDGPTRCSGLDIQRYGVEDLDEWFGRAFQLRDDVLEKHHTPAGGMQQFLYTWWQLRS